MTDPQPKYLRRGMWVVTTSGSSRIVLVRHRQHSWWCRLPGAHPDGSVSRSNADLRQQRLFGVVAGEHPSWDLCIGVVVGAPMTIHTGMSEWWDTSPVTKVRRAGPWFRWRLRQVLREVANARGRLSADEIAALARRVPGAPPQREPLGPRLTVEALRPLIEQQRAAIEDATRKWGWTLRGWTVGRFPGDKYPDRLTIVYGEPLGGGAMLSRQLPEQSLSRFLGVDVEIFLPGMWERDAERPFVQERPLQPWAAAQDD
ncbi:hypothetical protein [Nocardioides jiangxiensis]|uniref:Uncharacterized protein n=1 Tax=Nocardioides jiangxiensis TaxID=3064524 RepID=A0ABT9B4B7_9ACTN|nr:hypothetical protein [Nocardioides sp. WY-20]MDO7868156.1 hypothetical protein [Nocardioides sp. WY-20]